MYIPRGYLQSPRGGLAFLVWVAALSSGQCTFRAALAGVRAAAGFWIVSRVESVPRFRPAVSVLVAYCMHILVCRFVIASCADRAAVILFAFIWKRCFVYTIQEIQWRWCVFVTCFRGCSRLAGSRPRCSSAGCGSYWYALKGYSDGGCLGPRAAHDVKKAV